MRWTSPRRDARPTNLGDLIDEIAGLINSGDCQTAKDCAGAVNEGDALVESSDYYAVADVRPMANQELPATPVSRGSAAAETPTVEVEASEVATESVFVVDGISAEEVAEVEAEEPVAADDAYTDELLTALGGGYEPEARLEMVLELVDRVDESLYSLLVEHLLDIADEARAFGEEGLARKAEQVIKRLEPAPEE